jgi:multiple sugar transport system substrate-binding protein
VDKKKKSGLLLLLVCVVWAGAALYKYAQTRPPQKAVLTAVLYRGGGETPEALAVLAGEFQNQYPDIEISFVERSPAELEGDLAPVQQAKGRKGPGAPDIIIADEKSLALLSGDLFESLGSLSQNPELAERAQDGALRLPLVSFIYSLYYHIAALKEAGFDRPPKTREEFFAYARALPPFSSAVAPNSGGEELAAWTWAAGFNFFDGDALRAPALADSFNFLQDLISGDLLDPSLLQKTETENYDDFIAGRVAMMTASIAGTGYIEQHAPDLEYGITTVPPPAAYTGRPRFALGNWSAALASHSPRKEEAKLFIGFLADAPANAQLALALSGLPVNISAVSGARAGGGQYDKILAILETGEAVNELALTPKGPLLERALREAAVEIMSGTKTSDECVSALEALLAGD